MLCVCFIKAIIPLLAMVVNRPCLMGSCPNFLRSTYSYTECQLSFQTGSCPTERTTASYSSCLILISWLYPQAFLLISVDTYPCCAAGHCVMKFSLYYINNNGFLFPELCPASVVSGTRQDPGYFYFYEDWLCGSCKLFLRSLNVS